MSEERVMAGLDKRVNASIVSLVSNIHSNLVKGSPWDTGWSRANWVPGIGIPPTDEEKSKGDPAGAMARAQKGLIMVKVEYDYTGGEDVFISNNVPYTPILDAKHKTKAGFVSRAIDRAVARFAQ